MPVSETHLFHSKEHHRAVEGGLNPKFLGPAGSHGTS